MLNLLRFKFEIALQPINIEFMFVTCAVLKFPTFMLAHLPQSKNIYDMSVTFEVLKPEISAVSRLEHEENI